MRIECKGFIWKVTPGSFIGERGSETEKGRLPAQGVLLSSLAMLATGVQFHGGHLRGSRDHILWVISPMVRELGYLSPRAHKP